MLPVLLKEEEEEEEEEGGDLPALPCTAPTSPTQTSAHPRGRQSSGRDTGREGGGKAVSTFINISHCLVPRFYIVVDGSVINKNLATADDEIICIISA